MLKLDIDEEFQELSYLYDLFENITRIDYVPLEYREELKQLLIKAYKEGNQEFKKIHEQLKRLKVLEHNLDSEKYRLVNENQCLKNRVEDLEICFKELIKQNQELKEALKGIDTKNSLLIHDKYKLKKAIEILDDYLDLYFDIDSLTLFTNLGDITRVNPTKDDFDNFILLKEVLENENIE